MLETYQAELAYLRALARRLAGEYPEIAHLVSERQGDVSLERLFEGAALLFARTQLRIGDDLPEILHPLFERLWPQYLRPWPAAALLRFKNEDDLQQAYLVPADTPVRSIKVEGRACSFRTANPVEVLPMSVEQVQLLRPRPSELQLHLHFHLTAGTQVDTLGLKRLRFHLQAPEGVRDRLYLWLAHELRGVELQDPAGQVVLELPAAALEPWGLGDDQALIPHRPTPLPGLRLLEEFFFFKEKFWAFELSGLERIPPGRLTDQLRLVFRLGPLTEELALEPAYFGLGYTPVLNLSGSERIDLEVGDGVTELRVAAPAGGSVYSVERVGGYARQGGAFLDYVPLDARRTDLEDEVPRYQVLRRASEANSGEVYVAIVDREGNPRSPDSERVSIWLTATDGALTAKLGPGDISVPTSATPAFLELENVGAVRPSVPGAVGRDRLWGLLALFAATTHTLEDTEGLRQALRQALPDNSDLPSRLIVSVQAEASERLHHRMMQPVRQVKVQVAEDQLSGLGEVHLLGAILHRLYQRPGDHALAELTIEALPSGRVFTFS